MPSVSTNGLETYYDRRGAGHPVVFIHGSAWDHRQWLPQLTTLDQAYDVISYDVRGHGQTGGSERPTVTVETLVEDLNALIEALELDSPTLIGLSTGGRIAHAYAAAYPSVPGSLVTYEAPVRRESAGTSPLRTGVIRAYSTLYRVLGPYRAYKLQTWLRRTVGDLDDADGDAITVDGLGMSKREYIETAVKQVDTEENLKLLQSLGTRVDSPSQITVPTLVLTGDGPDSINEDAAAYLDAEIPHGRRQTLSDAGHAGNIDNPAGFNQQLHSFVSEVHPVDRSPL